MEDWTESGGMTEINGRELVNEIVASSTEAMNPSTKKFGEWFIVVYTSFSLLAGLKELVVRFQNRPTE